jgi:hypothetical protein
MELWTASFCEWAVLPVRVAFGTPVLQRTERMGHNPWARRQGAVPFEGFRVAFVLMLQYEEEQW